MLRTLTAAVLLVLSAVTVQAEDSLASRIHTAAVAACAPESSSSMPASHYGAITESCIARISNAAMVKYQSQAEAKTMASTAAN